ncbi:pyridoxamine 5'-phosphate oxidase [Curtobacterium sp. PhB130]|uniref:pyridoxal 5'-phosphate synthase n=1 Tax=unclassified Curtobacterium TaxID=257496 RepID=UPI000F4BF7AB|nr:MULTISPECIES: pyridoxal 5'-phosphate synthase [unclassified Curtobacterium]ROP63189.1 pyridoxamine 5'-phosphate oxidase [Curtobacterium sp. ZW137]ROS77456.1 pyridoxamine 5'-phosphate oxidase [Curtobacterium sp. PhB130]
MASAPLSGDSSFAFPELDDPPASPLDVARTWVANARDVSEPMSMTLATAADGAVSARTVDVKSIDDRGLVFGSSTQSPKGQQLTANPAAALQVYWRETMQQLRFEGVVVQLSDQESDELFSARSPKSRAATAVAAQSAPLEGSFQDLIDDANALLEESEDVPRPASWRAWRLEPTSVEFWHGSRDRMHRRLQYRRTADGWTSAVLQP